MNIKGAWTRSERRASVVFLASVGAILCATSEARAQEALDPEEREALTAPEPVSRFRPVSVTLNPLGLFVLGRYGANVEFLVAKHHALWLYPYFASFTDKKFLDELRDTEESTSASSSARRYNGFGAELGYHF